MHTEPLDLDRVVAQMKGRLILDGGLDRDYEGFHLFLSDGSTLIFSGVFIIQLCRREITLQ